MSEFKTIQLRKEMLLKYFIELVNSLKPNDKLIVECSDKNQLIIYKKVNKNETRNEM